MRVSLSCLAIALGTLSPRAEAVGLSIDGAGEAVLMPYYTVADGKSSIVSVTNHHQAPSVVRVVIAEGRNGRAALTFNVYLAARDSWHGALLGSEIPSPPIQPYLVTNDASCTSAVIPATGVPLRTDGYTGSRDDGLGNGIGRLFAGQVEVIELGTLTGAAAQLVQAGDCEGLRARFAAGGPWSTDPNVDVAAPAGLVSADLQLVDVAAGVAHAIDPLVLQGFSGGPRHGRGDDDFQSARIFKPTEKNAQGDFDVFGGSVDGDRPADAVSLLLMSSGVEFAYSVESSLDARTQAIITFPTRPAYVDNFAGGEVVGDTLPPFRRGPGDVPDCLVETFAAHTIDRSGQVGDTQPITLCEQVNVIAIADLPVDAGENGFDVEGVESGRIRVDFTATPPHTLNYTLGPVAGNAFAYGLPVMAASLIEVRNADAQPGVLASYAVTGEAVRHRDGIVDF